MHSIRSQLRYVPLVLLVLFVTADLAVGEYAIQRPTQAQAKEYTLDTAFYKKCTAVQGILIASSDRVSDYALKETAYQFDMIMKSIAPQVAQRIRDRGVLCLLIAHDEFTSDLPQFKTNKTGKELDFYNWRQRGFLTTKNGRLTVVFAEEDVLEYEGGMQRESILIHEFGHVIQAAGFDQKLQDRLTQAFESACAKGLWNDGRAAQRFRRIESKTPVRLFDALVKSFPDQPPELIRKCLNGGDILVNGKRSNARVKVTARDEVLIVFGGPKECYAHKNRAEYWAEGVQCWYDTNRVMDHDHNHIHTREGLRSYDPGLAKLCQDVLGDSPWRFVSPRLRAGQGHLKGFDPNDSPKVVDPKHIQEAANDYFDKYWHDYWQRLRDKYALLPKLLSEGAEALAEAARKQGDAVRGAVLFPKRELMCTQCHVADGDETLGPDLTKLAADTTDVYLVESLLDPSKSIRQGFESIAVRAVNGRVYSGRVLEQDEQRLVLLNATEPYERIVLAKEDIDAIAPSRKSNMPDGLVEQLANRQEFLDLVRYLMELRETARLAAENHFEHLPGGGSVAEDLRGLVLLDDLNCYACHTAEATPSLTPRRRPPDLANVGARIDPDYIRRFIADPQGVQPGTTMPNVMDRLDPAQRNETALAITRYLISLGAHAVPPQHTVDPEASQRGKTLFHSVGCVACHSPRSDDGTEVLADSSVPLGRIEAKYHQAGLTAFLEDPHAARPNGRMPNMRLSHSEASDIAHYLLQNASTRPSELDLGQSDEASIEKGRQQFRELGCAQCHDKKPPPKTAPTLTAANSDRGCLSGRPGKWPRYTLDHADRAAIRAALARGSQPLTPREQIAVSLTTFRCLACHQRDNLGGVAAERDEYFTTSDPNLGPQGRIPPPLTGVGAKLKPLWMRQVLVSGRTTRPYMNTRMPQFGADNVSHLIPLLEQVDKLPPVTYATFQDQKEIKKAGHELAGNTGLNCVACHTFQQKPAQTMSALDLTEMAERLRKDWFYHYMRTPQRFNRNTVMPTFWPGGRAMRKDILGGNADLQIEALWQYLLDGRQARTPRGLIREPIELLATDEAVMLRRNYRGIGKRGIGVGYPSRVNLAFDAEQMRLGMLWHGKFAETSGVWRGQGSGTVRPLGSDVLEFPRGPELDDARDPWVVDEGRPPRHQFKGYDLDDLQRPIFRYRFETVDVEDYCIDVRDAKTGDVLIRRTLTFHSANGRTGAAFRVIDGEDIVQEDNGTFRVGKRLRITIDSNHHAQIADAPAGKRLLIPLDIPAGTSSLVLEYRW